MHWSSEEEPKFWVRSPHSTVLTRIIVVSIIDLPPDNLCVRQLAVFPPYASDKRRKCSFLRDKSEGIDLEGD
jgi:hypothetical protein